MLEVGGLTAGWAGLARWHLLVAQFDRGQNFLNLWRAWRADPLRPRMLHVVALTAHAPAISFLFGNEAAEAETESDAASLAKQCWGLVSGMHRLSFDDGHVLLTLCVGDRARMLAQEDFAVHGVLANDTDAAEAQAFAAALPRHCRRGALLAATLDTPSLRHTLQQQGFSLVPAPPKTSADVYPLRGAFQPAWGVRRRAEAVEPTRALVIGGGLAGAGAAASLSWRGWQVSVLDAAEEPASGASALPAGLLAPHSSPDDSLLSRLTRSGVRVTLDQAAALLVAGEDWALTGVRERRGSDVRQLPDLGPGQEAWQCRDTPHDSDVWHAAGAWIKPRALVRAWLSLPGIQWRGSSQVGRLVRTANEWCALDADERALASAPLVVVAAATQSARLLPQALTLHAVRGQVTTGSIEPHWVLPASPVNGNGHFLPGVPDPQGRQWLTGSTYVRGDLSLEHRRDEDAANLQRLKTLLPAVAEQLASSFERSAVRSWVGIRCSSADRRPLLGEAAPGLWVSTAMGSRGLTFAALCGELLAARLHCEPLPLPQRLAQALSLQRQLR